MEQRQYAALIMFFVSSLGFGVNVLVVFAVPHVSYFANSFFGRVARIQALSGACHGAISAFLTAPILFFEIPLLERRNATVYFAFALEFVYEISSYSHVLLAANRFIVLFFGLEQRSLNVPSWIKLIIIAIPLLLSESILVLTYVNEKCTYYLDTTTWGYNVDEDCVEFRLNTYFSRYVAMLILVAILDIACVFKKTRTNAASNRKCAVEHRLLYQACAQASIFLADITSAFLIVPHFSSDQWARFVLSTVVWAVAMSADGFLIFLFNKEIRHVVIGKARCKIPGTSTVTSIPNITITRSRNETNNN